MSCLASASMEMLPRLEIQPCCPPTNHKLGSIYHVSSTQNLGLKNYIDNHKIAGREAFLGETIEYRAADSLNLRIHVHIFIAREFEREQWT